MLFNVLYILLSNNVINRRNLLFTAVPLDNVGNNTVLNSNISPITSCYFDIDDKLWKPFDYTFI